MSQIIGGLCVALASVGLIMLTVAIGYLMLTFDDALLPLVVTCGVMAAIGFAGLTYLDRREARR